MATGFWLICPLQSKHPLNLALKIAYYQTKGKIQTTENYTPCNFTSQGIRNANYPDPAVNNFYLSVNNLPNDIFLLITFCKTCYD